MALFVATMYIYKHRHIHKRLFEELVTSIPDESQTLPWSELEMLEYLSRNNPRGLIPLPPSSYPYSYSYSYSYSYCITTPTNHFSSPSFCGRGFRLCRVSPNKPIVYEPSMFILEEQKNHGLFLPEFYCQ
jgi:hypothetical protein